ncbi:conserved hypothetical protein [Solidesulfovibrio fructosivorans JJ]]|uniref:Uncharacterized protein n=1 Tax=Solidesulfovibrio fructosivorans JJ] TaxID=596151 RepID=E1JUS8_SOLFR|nr:conserved hypothetical protein [Solidesulfovibrio fructosivorans JJ]]
MTEHTTVEMAPQPQASPRTSTDIPRQEGKGGNVKALTARGEDEHGPYTDTFSYPAPGTPSAEA